ncbi:MAG: CPBP family intramembrane glutamic endopeptidase [Bacteroidota bacterium]
MTFFEFVKESQLNADIILNADFFSYGAMWGGIISIIIYLLSARIFKIKMEHIFPMKIPALKHWMIWAGIMILFGLAGAFVNANTDLLKTDFMEKFAATMTNQTTALLGIGIFAPIAEELLFRGILYKGLKDALNGVAAVWIISVIFAGIHVPQYLNSDVNLANVGAMSMLLLSLSLILGFARHYSKSILIPIVLHILNNSLTVFFGSGA